MEQAEFLHARVASTQMLCEGVLSIDLVAESGPPLQPVGPGEHVDLHLGNGQVRQYSIYEFVPATATYRIAVQRDRNSRGGSTWVHENLKPGVSVKLGTPRNGFPLELAGRYLFVAGGIGITPILSMFRAAQQRGHQARLFYCTRSAEVTPFKDILVEEVSTGAITLTHDQGDPARGLDLRSTLGAFDGKTGLYCCGPQGLMDAVKRTAIELGWPSSALHFEYFAPAAIENGKAQKNFRIRIASTGVSYEVAPEKTILEVLRDEQFRVEFSCCQGICGTCCVGVLDGVIDHRDSYLDDAERASNKIMTICVSRAQSDELLLDL